MKNLANYFLIFALVLLIGYFFFNKKEKNNEKEQIQVVLNEIKNVSKLVVTESSISEQYNYQSADKYFFETISFDKKVILLVNAKIQIAYDLAKMNVKIDSINKKISIKNIPKAEINIIPNITYFDLQQSAFNTFSKEELNTINQKSIAKIKESVEVSQLEKQAKKQLLIELKKLYTITQILDWKLVDETQEKIIKNSFKD